MTVLLKNFSERFLLEHKTKYSRLLNRVAAFHSMQCSALFIFDQKPTGSSKLQNTLLNKSFKNAAVLPKNYLFLDAPIKIQLDKYFRKILLIKNNDLVRRGFRWYATLQGIDVEGFIKSLEMPDTFASWFKIVELHVWILLFRLMQDGPEFNKTRRALINAMWEDASERAKVIAPQNRNYKRNFKSFYSEFTTVLFAYDEAFLTDDRALLTVLWYYFFGKSCDDPLKLEALVSYIRCQVNHLQTINTRDIEEASISSCIWIPFHVHFSDK